VVAVSAGLLFAVARLKTLANDPRLFKLSFACAVTAAVLIGYNTNIHDLSLLILPLALIADHCVPLLPWSSEKARIVVPIVPLLISPLWFFLWMRWERTNLMAFFLLWWLYAIGREILRMREDAGGSGELTLPA
jgi:hypothetical protein